MAKEKADTTTRRCYGPLGFTVTVVQPVLLHDTSIVAAISHILPLSGGRSFAESIWQSRVPYGKRQRMLWRVVFMPLHGTGFQLCGIVDDNRISTDS